ncbi:lytic murein transglycosylase [Mycobacterium sp. CVI_P3]|uniref:Lytic murein transglycosylase n=1 Tax=Mycobacterium pinniadriaticum TaxID=2994102 RepID=A0ABT3SE82_9MYCO|nr:lytic murein transglycosylase [Mycobacterium pinniadriaticum]MCX2930771.1 lytic murein transglycosylase [Mycobacterium pinniadriaticum]MCX2937195.1 lytic murein transglycosylase [Mycobacterium pinniadriaticum]
MVRKPAFGIAVLTPVVLAGAVGAAPDLPRAPVFGAEVTPLAAVSPQTDTSGATVVALSKQPTNFHFAAATPSVPPPAVVVNSPGSMRIPSVALAAYRNAEQAMAATAPGCGLSWNLLAGIGRIESMHANGGATDSRGTAINPIYGPTLDGTLAGNEVIVQTVQAGRPIYARAMGPMQFLPGTWSRYAADGDGDSKADPQNVYDSALAAARYLCSGGLNLRNQSQVLTAILRYNNSMAYAQNVLGWAAAYATGVEPINLPPIVGPVPALGDAHLEHPEGLGPGLPLNAIGLPSTDPLTQLNLGNSETAGQIALGPLPGPAGALPTAPCEVICLGSQAPPVAAPPVDAPPPAAPPPWPPFWMPPPPPPPPPAPVVDPAPAAPAAPLPDVHGALPGPAA